MAGHRRRTHLGRGHRGAGTRVVPGRPGHRDHGARGPERTERVLVDGPCAAAFSASIGIVEEVLVVGYLFARLRDLGWGKWQIILVSALLRGSYHLYQGFGSFVGNVAMGVLFGWLYARYGRVVPLIVAHFLIDAVTFVGYQWAASALPALFGLPLNPVSRKN